MRVTFSGGTIPLLLDRSFNDLAYLVARYPDMVQTTSVLIPEGRIQNPNIWLIGRESVDCTYQWEIFNPSLILFNCILNVFRYSLDTFKLALWNLFKARCNVNFTRAFFLIAPDVNLVV